jgi:predicted SnoaL-like aldol condensation-catalyzing enzyme
VIRPISPSFAADIFRVRDGKIIERWEVADTGPFVALARTN